MVSLILLRLVGVFGVLTEPYTLLTFVGVRATFEACPRCCRICSTPSLSLS